MELSFELKAARGKHDPSTPWDQPGQDLYLNGVKIGWVPGDLKTVASRPTCHELGCPGCNEGYATAVARVKLERQELEDLKAAHNAPGRMMGECCDRECYESGYDYCVVQAKIDRMERELGNG